MGKGIIDSLPLEQLADLCRKYRVQELSIFGSALRDDFRPDSDIDLLVEFEPDSHPTLMTLAGMQIELEELLGRDIDLVPKGGLKPLIRQSVLDSSEVLFAAA